MLHHLKRTGVILAFLILIYVPQVFTQNNQIVPRVSVLMPVYNTEEEYFRKAIEDILAQTYTNFEFIIIDDGSTTDIEKIVRSYEDKRIRFYKNPKNLGIARTTNRMLDLAKGEFVTLVDSDDMFSSNLLQEEVAFLDKHPDISVASCYLEKFPSGVVWRFPTKVRYIDLMMRNMINNSGCTMRLADINRYHLRYDDYCLVNQDYEFWSRVVRYLKIENIPKVLTKYRIRPNSTMRSVSVMALAKVDTTIRKNMVEFLTGNPELREKLFGLAYSRLANYNLILEIWNYLRRIFYKEKTKQ